MKRIAALVLVVILVGPSAAPAPADAHGGAAAAVALGAFALWSTLVIGAAVTSSGYPVVYPAPVYAIPASTYAAAPAPVAVRREVVYPHGRYVLYGDGVTTAYQWVWLPTPTPPPPPPGAPPAPPPLSR
ncbi:MAG: hypothetical protein HY294_08055 [Candidatus Rokubacteria bacterium]|nr:hypothetical protein [Candidatus Rokubacteria bacterium]